MESKSQASTQGESDVLSVIRETSAMTVLRVGRVMGMETVVALPVYYKDKIIINLGR